MIAANRKGRRSATSRRRGNRHGNRHAASRGSVNVLSAAPVGYRYITRREDDGQAAHEINGEQAAIIRAVFEWVGRDRLPIREVTRRLRWEGMKTATGKDWVDCTSVWGKLKTSINRLCGVRQDADRPTSIKNFARSEAIAKRYVALVRPTTLMPVNNLRSLCRLSFQRICSPRCQGN